MQRNVHSRSCYGFIDSNISMPYLMYSWFSGRHLGYIPSDYFRKHWQHMDCMSNEFSDLGTIWIAIGISTIYSLQAYYAMYANYSGRHLWFITSSYFQQRWQLRKYVQRVGPPRKYRGSHWNFDDMKSGTRDTWAISESRLDRAMAITSKCLCGIEISSHQNVWKL